MLAQLRACAEMSHVQIGEALGLDRAAIRVSLARLQKRGQARFIGMTDTPRNWGTVAPDSIWAAVPATDE